ncbi:MAG TPA: hypothetical protein VFB82_02090 [Blastocatellia bacterium]|nr:hypothetical protein [Blastocatellia bacterium]
MNGYRRILQIPMRICSIVLLTSFVGASARAQTPATAPLNDDRWETTSALPFPSRFPLSFAPSGLGLMPPGAVRVVIDQRVIKELDDAWRYSGCGTNDREGVVLIFRMKDGTYNAKQQGFTNEYKKFTFKWNPAALAIIHTHPNTCDPRPSKQDRRVADKYGVPNFTITLSGMYVYDPSTKTTSKVLNGLDWLNPSTLDRWIRQTARSVEGFSETGPGASSHVTHSVE